MEKYMQIVKYNLKYNIPPHFIISVLLLLCSPLILGLGNLNRFETAKVLEMYVVLVGIIMITPIFLPEQNKDIRDLLSTKALNMAVVYGIRVLQAVVLVMIMVSIFVAVLKMGNCDFPTIPYFFGTMAGILAIGGTGMVFYALADQVVVGYMIPLLYYLISYGTKDKYLGKLYLFSMSDGRVSEKLYLAIVGILFIGLGIWIRCRKSLR